jgi:SAM-dependent methyltransferase
MRDDAKAEGHTVSADRCGLLGDTAARDYSSKLLSFNAFAERELRAAIASLALRTGMRVLDAGCGCGSALEWLAEAVGPAEPGAVVGLELSRPHALRARAAAASRLGVIQGDLTRPPLAASSFDLIWSVNTINHLRDPRAGLRRLAMLLKPGGRIAIGQSSLLPDMYFAWDSRLERLTREAVLAYYRDRYGLSECDLTAVRSLLGPLLDAGLRPAGVRTFVIERTQPLAPADEAYLLEAIFRGTWGERLKPYLRGEDRAELARLCDPDHPAYALRRPDFHFIQTFTLAVGANPA